MTKSLTRLVQALEMVIRHKQNQTNCWRVGIIQRVIWKIVTNALCVMCHRHKEFSNSLLGNCGFELFWMLHINVGLSCLFSYDWHDSCLHCNHTVVSMTIFCKFLAAQLNESWSLRLSDWNNWTELNFDSFKSDPI